MNRTLASLAGLALAAGLAIAAPSDTPESLAIRYFAATDDAGVAESWSDWHPEATHSITVKYGMGYPDDIFSYRMDEWETLPDWNEVPELASALDGYWETARDAPVLATEEVENGTEVTAVTSVSYEWKGYTGQMTQTDRFHVTPLAGQLLIRSLETTYDYR